MKTSDVESTPGARLLLVVMPFVSLKRPVLAASLLQSIVNGAGHRCDVTYPAFSWADEIGLPFYEFVAGRSPTQHLVGEWMFAEAAFGDQAPDPALFVNGILNRHDMYPKAVVDKLVECRRAAPAFIERLLDGTDWGSYDAVGFTSSFQQNVASLALAAGVKKRHPAIVTLFGGANVEGEMGIALHSAFEFVDVVVSGEADRSLPLLLDRIATGEQPCDVAGVTYRWNGQEVTTLSGPPVEALDELPYPDHGAWYNEFEGRKLSDHMRPELTMETSRGCWWGERHQCTFCGLNGGTIGYRSKSPARARDEILWLQQHYGGAGIFATDNILDHGYFRTLFPRLIEDGVSINLSYETKSSLRKAHLATLRRLGTTWFQPGIESLSTPVLHLIDKGTRAINNVQLLKWAREFGLSVTWNIISGFPGETAADYEEMLRTVRLISHLSPPASFAQFRLDRFSPLFERAGEFGLEPISPHAAYGFCYPLNHVELRSLAYFFEHSYAVPEDVRVVVYELWLEVEEWKRHYPSSTLEAIVTPAFLYLDDRRWGREPQRHLFTGLERAVYLATDQIQSLGSLTRSLSRQGFGAVDPQVLRGVVNEFVCRDLMMREGDSYLSLAVLPAGSGDFVEDATERPIPLVAV